MTLRRCWSGACCLSLTLFVGLVRGQALPSDIVRTAQPLTPAQVSQIDSYTRRWVDPLMNGEQDRDIADARAKLIEPFNVGGSTLFVSGYASSLTNAMIDAKAISSDRAPVVRLNAMIVVSYLQTPGAIRLMTDGLSDTSPAARYWAGKAVQRLGEALRANANLINSADLDTLIRAVVAALDREPFQPVVEQMLTGLGKLGTPAAAEQLLDVLIQRVSLHAENPSLPIGAERQALLDQYQALAQGMAASTDNPPVGVLRKMLLAGFRYLELSVKALERQGLDLSVRNDYQNLIQLGDQLLPWSAQQLGAQGELPGSIKGTELGEAKLRVELWRSVLLNPPFSFPRDQVSDINLAAQ